MPFYSEICTGIECVNTIIFEATKTKYTYQVCVEPNNNPHIQISQSSNQDKCSTCNPYLYNSLLCP